MKINEIKYRVFKNNEFIYSFIGNISDIQNHVNRLGWFFSTIRPEECDRGIIIDNKLFFENDLIDVKEHYDGDCLKKAGIGILLIEDGSWWISEETEEFNCLILSLNEVVINHGCEIVGHYHNNNKHFNQSFLDRIINESEPL
jgi:hypothetical protein